MEGRGFDLILYGYLMGCLVAEIQTARTGSAVTGTGGAVTGTGGAVCKGATPSVEQQKADGALAPVRSSLDTSFGDRTSTHE